MSIRHSLSALAVALALSGFGSVAAAADSMPVNREQADKLQVGHSEADVRQICGEPMDVTHWMGGTYSLSYVFAEEGEAAQFLYVDFDAQGHLISTEIIENDGGEGPDEDSGSESVA